MWNSVPEEELLEKLEKAHKAHEASTDDWAKNYWLTVIGRLKNRFSTY